MLNKKKLLYLNSYKLKNHIRQYNMYYIKNGGENSFYFCCYLFNFLKIEFNIFISFTIPSRTIFIVNV